MAYRRKSLELNHGACLPEEEKHIRDVHLSCFLIEVSEGKRLSLLPYDNYLHKD